MPYDLTYKRNIINKTNEQNRTRDLERKNKVILTTGDRRGNYGEKRGKGCQGTCIMDTWRKPKGGRIRVGGGDG